ncbi:MAG: response regulator transcription factor [Bernardetiaceae bacterium]|nr:response regulator transcription factor [Bernardetiaceae bacterium]
MKKILLIEDDFTLSRNIKEALTDANWQVEVAYQGAIAEKLLQREFYDCIILDINLPDKSGYDICQHFRRYNQSTPVLMLTAFGELEDKVQGFECGADDYLTKPFYIRELILRIQSLLKRSEKTAAAVKEILTVGDIVIDLSAKAVSRQGKTIDLTPRELQILVKLAENQGEVISKKELIETIWGRSIDINTNTIEVYINFLRNKIDKPFGTNSIRTKPGYGYYLDAQ